MARILVIDDCEEIAEVIRQLLEQAGYFVETAYDSSSAISAMGTSSFDAVLCDLVLPLLAEERDDDVEGDSPMVGMHCIHELSRSHPEIPVIAMSGELVGAPLSVVQNFGAWTTLSKPFDSRQLLAAVSGVLQKS